MSRVASSDWADLRGLDPPPAGYEDDDDERRARADWKWDDSNASSRANGPRVRRMRRCRPWVDEVDPEEEDPGAEVEFRGILLEI